MLAVAEREQLPVADARAGNAEAWAALFQRYRLPLYVYIYELVRDEQTSLDLVQETFLSAFRHLKSLREDEKFGSWLFSIAHQKCVQLWRRRDQKVEPEMPEVDDSPVELLIREEQEEQFMKLLEELPVAQRSAVVLHYVEDFSLDEIARITGTNAGTVKSRLHYAKRTLRKLLEETP